MPTTCSGTPPVAIISKSLAPTNVSIDEWNDPAAAVPAKSIAKTTATPSAIASTVRVVRVGSLHSGRTIKR